MLYIGELAALATAFCWSFTAIFFTEAGRLIGSFRVNNICLAIAVALYALILLITAGFPLPQNINVSQMSWLGISGIIGFVIGDSAGLKAMVILGPRTKTLIFSTSPVIATIIAWLFLDERLTAIELFGIGVTLTGVLWVILEKKERIITHFALADNHPDSGTTLKGILLALVAAACQATGMVLSKQGMLYSGGIVEPLPASMVRLIFATAVIWLFAVFKGEAAATLQSLKNPKAMLHTVGGVIFGPFLGVWMSLVALKHISAGIAATLSAMTPILIIPVVIFYYKEKVSPREIIGAVVAVLGVALLFTGDALFRLF
ncbi:MAG: DMT family transporter [candidate division Zixibacteria bacterium]|mgnify:CR=1 FL=1|nr:DMT family transporter [candidate division Zixibacteria bacterium]